MLHYFIKIDSVIISSSRYCRQSSKNSNISIAYTSLFKKAECGGAHLAMVWESKMRGVAKSAAFSCTFILYGALLNFKKCEKKCALLEFIQTGP
jgi:hypothetical protein